MSKTSVALLLTGFIGYFVFAFWWDNYCVPNRKDLQGLPWGFLALLMTLVLFFTLYPHSDHVVKVKMSKFLNPASEDSIFFYD